MRALMVGVGAVLLLAATARGLASFDLSGTARIGERPEPNAVVWLEASAVGRDSQRSLSRERLGPKAEAGFSGAEQTCGALESPQQRWWQRGQLHVFALGAFPGLRVLRMWLEIMRARVSTVRSVGAQTGESSSAWGNKKCFYRIRFSCPNLNRISPLCSASRRLTVRFIFGYVFRSCSRHYRAAPAREHEPKYRRH